MNVILLEKVNKLGDMGEVVTVRPGYARNYLLPQKKALRATDDNKAYFDSQRANLEKLNGEKRDAAATEAKKLEGLTVAMIRQASEGGQLYGSVTARDISEILTEETGVKVQRNMIDLNQNFKTLGLFKLTVSLHAEVLVEVTLNIARTMDEAAVQLKTGKAMINMDREEKSAAKAAEDVADAMDEEAEAETMADDAETEEVKEGVEAA